MLDVETPKATPERGSATKARAAIRALTAAVLLGQANLALAQQNCGGTFESLYRQSDPQLREFFQGVWQGEGPDPFGNVRRYAYSFDVNGTFTRDETVCFRATNTCHPTAGQGYFAVYSVQQGVISLALYESNRNCSVSYLVIGDRDTLYGAQDQTGNPLRRVR
jgi:hypothetical protein